MSQQFWQFCEILVPYTPNFFGSAARGELTPTSNIVLLVEPAGPVDYGQLLLLQETLEEATGRKFAALTSIKQSFRLYIESEIIKLLP